MSLDATRLTYSLAETAEILGGSRSCIYSLTKRGLIKPSKILRKVVFTKSEIERFVATLDVEGGAQ